ncbi:MAG: SRPBCC family protein [Nocardioidaceae bacterium]
MKLTGTVTMHADRETVWRALNDPSVLVRTIPGCRRLEALGEDAYAMTVSAGVGSITGVYDGRVALTDQQQPASFRLHAQGSGAPGTIGADVNVALTDGSDGGTELTYDADAVVGGAIGGVGQRMLAGVSKRMAAQFFANVDAALAGGQDRARPSAEAAPPDHPASASSGLPPDPATVGAAPALGRSLSPQPGTVFTAPGSADTTRALVTARGVLVGAGAALAGVLVGGWIGRRRR